MLFSISIVEEPPSSVHKKAKESTFSAAFLFPTSFHYKKMKAFCLLLTAAMTESAQEGRRVKAALETVGVLWGSVKERAGVKRTHAFYPRPLAPCDYGNMVSQF